METNTTIVWKMVSEYGCNFCRNLITKKGLPMCGHTSELLETKLISVQKSSLISSPEQIPFPSARCPFRPN